MASSSSKPAILLIYTGGTIGMKTDPQTGALMPFDFNDLYAEFPNLKYLDVDIDMLSFKPIDSSNVTPELWGDLARIIKEKYDLFDGFVVMHGTDTMSYTASALSFALENLDKPVIFTGSQIPVGVMRTDGPENLITAIEIAAAKHEDGSAMVPEVGLYFQSQLYRANRTTKYSAEVLNAFRSHNYPALADVGVRINYNTLYINRPAEKTKELRIHTEFNRNVLIISLFPGITEATMRAMLSMPHIEGVVLETYGAGNAPTADWFIDLLRSTINRGVPVLNVTQCKSGGVSMDLYDTGIRLQQIGVISGMDITVEAAVTKLMYLLGLGLPKDELVAQLKESVKGEISA